MRKRLFDVVFALMALIGLLGTLERRLRYSKARRVTSAADWIIEVLLLLQVVAGIYIAVFHPWGSSWYATSETPYLRSIFFLRPDISYLATLPIAVRLHMINAWLIVGLFPFTRLVHVLVAPFPYLWRKPQVVRWYGMRMPGRARGASARG